MARESLWSEAIGGWQFEFVEKLKSELGFKGGRARVRLE
jgi:hypothetical protein